MLSLDMGIQCRLVCRVSRSLQPVAASAANGVSSSSTRVAVLGIGLMGRDINKLAAFDAYWSVLALTMSGTSGCTEHFCLDICFERHGAIRLLHAYYAA